MEKLSVRDAAAFRVEVDGLSYLGDRLSLQVTVRNGSTLPVSAGGVNPVNLAWFVVDRDGAGPWIGEFDRMPLTETIGPGATGSQACTIALPAGASGRRLVVTLVQEGNLWFHLDPVRVFATVDLEFATTWWNSRQARSIAFANVEQLNQTRLKPFFEQNGSGRPLFLHLETVNICNLKCVICPYVVMRRDKETMDAELFETILDDYVDMGGGDVGLTPSVGDIFLDRRIVDRVRSLRRRPEIRSIGFVTNAGNAGVLSDDDLSYVVNECARINISVYGLDEEENAAMTRRPGRFAQIQTQIKRIVGLNRSAMIVFAFRLLKADAERRAAAWMTETFGQTFPHEVLTTYGNWGGAIDIAEPLPFQGDWLQPEADPERSARPCAYPALHLKVAVNGDVKFCSCIDYDSLPENIIGNVREQSLSDIYNGLRAKRLWNDGLTICRGCTHHKPIDVFERHIAALHSPIEKLGI